MNHNPTNPTPAPAIPWLRKVRWACASFAIALLAACGGGGGAEAITPADSLPVTTGEPVAKGELSSTVIPVGLVAAQSISPVYDAEGGVSSININDPATAAQAKPGAILVLPATADVPSGLALKIATSIPTATGVQITFTQPLINEVFDNLEIRLRKDLSAEDVNGVSLPAGVKLITQAVPNTQAGIAVLPAGAEGMTLVFNPKSEFPTIVEKGSWTDILTGDEFRRGGNYSLGKKIGFKFEKLVLADKDGKYLIDNGQSARGPSGNINVGDATTNDQLRVSGDVLLNNAAIDFDMKIEDRNIMRMGARMNGTIETKLKFGYQWQDAVSLTDTAGKVKNGFKVGSAFEVEGVDFSDERIILGNVGIGLVGLVPTMVGAPGNSVPVLTIGAILSLSYGMKGELTADVVAGFDYKAYFDQGLYLGKSNKTEALRELKKYNIFSHGDYPNPNVPGARPATKADLDKKPFFSFGADGSMSYKYTTQMGIDLSVVVAGMIPVQINNPLEAVQSGSIKGSAWRREAGWDIVGCAESKIGADLKSIFIARLQGKVDGPWNWTDGQFDLVDKKYTMGKLPVLPETGLQMKCTVDLLPTVAYSLSPTDLPTPASGKTTVRFSGDAQWVALNSLSKTGSANVDTWGWKFGESDVKDLSNALMRPDQQYPIYTYDNPGTYKVTLTVKDVYGQEARVEKLVTIPILGYINASPDTPTVMETVSLWIRNAYDTVKSVVWNFGVDIAEQTAAVANGISTTITQAFSTTGIKPVTATLKDEANKTLGTLTTAINVSALPMPTATITGATSDTAAQPGAIANNGTTDDTTPTLKGTLNAALTGTQHVNIYDWNTQFVEYAVVIGTTWTFTPSAPLSGGSHLFMAEVGDALGAVGAPSDPYVINISAPGITSATPTQAMRTVPTTFTVAGRDLPTSGITVTMPDDTDTRAKCNAPTGMTATGFTVVCTLYKFDEATDAQRKLVISAGAKQLGTHTVSIQSNITDVNWAAPSTGNVYGKGTVQFKEDITFKATGTNLLADTGMGFAVELCGVANKEVGTPTNTQRTFTCMFNNEAGAVAGQMPLVFKDKQGGGGLFRVNVPVVVAPVLPSIDIEFSELKLNALGASGSDYTLFSGYKNRPAVKFNGGSIRIPNRSELQFDDAATFDMWIRLDSDIGMHGYGGFDSVGWAMALLAKSHDRVGFGLMLGDKRKSHFASFDASWACGTSISFDDVNISIGEWFRVTVVASSLSGMSFYAKQKLIYSCPDARPSFAQSNTEDMYLGRFSDSWYPFNGAMQDLRIYKKALTPSEVAALP